MTSKQVLDELKKLGSENIKKIFIKHGAKEPIYGVKVEDLKKVDKKIKENRQQIALELFDSGVGDAMYLAGLVADGSKMNKKQLQAWAKNAISPMVSEYSVAWVASENEDAWNIALEWIDSPQANIACAGWATLNSIMATWPDEKIDIPTLKKLLTRIEKEIHKAPNRVRSCMNSFVIATGSYMKDLTQTAIATGKKNGVVMINVGDTACKVPFAPDYIKKVIDKGNVGKKRKMAKC